MGGRRHTVKSLTNDHLRCTEERTIFGLFESVAPARGFLNPGRQKPERLSTVPSEVKGGGSDDPCGARDGRVVEYQPTKHCHYCPLGSLGCAEGFDRGTSVTYYIIIYNKKNPTMKSSQLAVAHRSPVFIPPRARKIDRLIGFVAIHVVSIAH